jgi:hypothetical protein
MALDIGRYVKKSVEIEAVKMEVVNRYEVSRWIGCDFLLNEDGILIPTLEGEMKASPGDWVIKGVEGEFYPCKASVFDKTYDRAPEDSDR